MDEVGNGPALFIQSKTFPHKLLTNYNTEENITDLGAGPHYRTWTWSMKPYIINSVLLLSDSSRVILVAASGKYKLKDLDKMIAPHYKNRLAWEITLYLFLCPVWPLWTSPFSLLLNFFQCNESKSKDEKLPNWRKLKIIKWTKAKKQRCWRAYTNQILNQKIAIKRNTEKLNEIRITCEN